MVKRPGGELATRPLQFIWIVDCSGSMGVDGKMQALNVAVREAIPHMQRVADENPNAQVLVRAIKFSSGAQWQMAQPTPVGGFRWTDLQADGVTDLGHALIMVADELKMPPMPERSLPPVLVLISDGQPTDDYESGITAVMAQPWGVKAVRLAVAIGNDADQEALQKFIGNPELRPLQANNPEALVSYIKWASTAVLKAASAPPSQVQGGSDNNIALPPPPPPPVGAGDVF